MTPKFIDAILGARVFHIFARVALTVALWLPGIMQATQFQNAIGDFTHFHVTPPVPYIIASIITLMVGSAIVIRGGRWTWVGAGALGIYTGLTIFIAHAFWTMQGADAVNEMRTAFEHISMIGGLMVVAIAEHQRAKTAA